MEKNIKMSIETAREIYKYFKANLNSRDFPTNPMCILLLENFTKEELEGVGYEVSWNLYEKFLDENGLTADLPYSFDVAHKDLVKRSQNAYAMLIQIIKHVNKGWIPDYSNVEQYKYYPWFRFEKNSFVFSSYCYDSCYTTVGSLLVYKDKKVLKETVNKYLPIYNDYLK